ncbi:MAG: hypothetical protein R2844_16010 [Caldilineales bacterium]
MISPEDIAGWDILVVSSPTQKFRPTSPIKQLLKSLPGFTARRAVAAFDTLDREEINSTGF